MNYISFKLANNADLFPKQKIQVSRIFMKQYVSVHTYIPIVFIIYIHIWILSLFRLIFLKPGSDLEFTILTNLEPVNIHSPLAMDPYSEPSDGFQTFATG